MTLYNSSDIKRLQGSTKLLFPQLSYLREVYQAVVEYLQIPIGAQPDRYFHFEIADFCKKFQLKPLSTAPALRLLAQEGFWSLTDAVFRPPSLRFLAPREELDTLGSRYPLLGAVCTALLRMYTGIFRYPVVIDVFNVARKLRWKKDDLSKALLQLAAMGIIEWEPVDEGPRLFFHSYRADSRELIFDTARIESLRNRHESRIQAMLNFVNEQKSCRSIVLLNYFGEKAERPCGHCDHCRSAQTSVPGPLRIRELVHEILDTTPKAVSLGHLTSRFPEEARKVLHETLRDMVDCGELDWHTDNSFTQSSGFLKKHTKTSRL